MPVCSKRASEAGTLVNYKVGVFAKGVHPGTPPTFADASVNPSGVMNRTDSFGFSIPGRYLVICNVRGHFLDGMYAWTNVADDDDSDRHAHLRPRAWRAVANCSSSASVCSREMQASVMLWP